MRLFLFLVLLLNTAKAGWYPPVGLQGGTLGKMTGELTMQAQKQLRFADSDSSNYVALQAPATIATNFTLTMPTAQGGAGSYLKNDGSGNLSWDTPSGGGSTKHCAARVAANGTLDNEVGNCFDGNCSWNSGNGRTSCFFLSGYFTGDPVCTITPFHANGDHRGVSIITLNSSDLVYRISASDSSQQNQASTITCTGSP